jgi:hypothetical protein
MSKAIFDAAKKLLDQGCSVIPIVNGDKKPAIAWDDFKKRLPTDEEIKTWFENTNHQLGLVTGNVSGGWCILDFDGEGWFDLLKQFLAKFPKLQDTLSVATGGGKMHLHFISPTLPEEVSRIVRKFDNGQIELRANGHQSLVPPSSHPSGGQYKYINPDKPPILVLTNELREITDWLRISKDGKKVTGEKQEWKEDFDEPVMDGERHDVLKRWIAHWIGGKKLSKPEILQLALAKNETFKPPLEDKEVKDFVDSMCEFVKEDVPEDEPKLLDEPKPTLYSQLIEADAIDENEPEKWVVDGLIPEAALTILYGPPGVAKSHIVWSMGQAQASGEDVFGCSTKQGPVYYLDYENPRPVIAHMKLIGGGGKMKILPVQVDKPPLDSDGFSEFESWPIGTFYIDTWNMAIAKKLTLTGEDRIPLLRKLRRLCAKGHSVVIILHPLKGDDKTIKSPQEMMGHTDHILLVHEVKTPGEVEPTESELEEDPNRAKYLYLGCEHKMKSRYSKKAIWLWYDPRRDSEERGIRLAATPSDELLIKLHEKFTEYMVANGFISENGIATKTRIPRDYPRREDLITLITEWINVSKRQAWSLLKKAVKNKLIGKGEGNEMKEGAKRAYQYDYYFPIRQIGDKKAA